MMILCKITVSSQLILIFLSLHFIQIRANISSQRLRSQISAASPPNNKKVLNKNQAAAVITPHLNELKTRKLRSAHTTIECYKSQVAQVSATVSSNVAEGESTREKRKVAAKLSAKELNKSGNVNEKKRKCFVHN